MSTLKAATRYFAIVFGAGFVLGAIRVPFLVPRLGERWAELLEMPLMLVAIVLAARHVVRRCNLARAWSACLRVGTIALAMMVAAELLLAAALGARSVSEYVARRDPVSGSVYLAMLLVFALMPAIVARHDRRGRPHAGEAAGR